MPALQQLADRATALYPELVAIPLSKFHIDLHFRPQEAVVGHSGRKDSHPLAVVSQAVTAAFQVGAVVEHQVEAEVFQVQVAAVAPQACQAVEAASRALQPAVFQAHQGVSQVHRAAEEAGPQAALDVSSLLEWDGGKRTAIKAFVEIQELAAMGGYILVQIGTYLWQKLNSGSAVESWFLKLPEEWKVIMGSHFLNHIHVTKTYWLGDAWINRMHDLYRDMRFCQRRGYKNKLPRKFIQACLLYSRILSTATRFKR
ncbi:hypothetical protein B0H16DRAFT_1739303 [Mycena metata]|uniref:Uncharacterized protein n=1 Tax=Mycena metata TaxID=1033252 RepID=A0AAD7HFA1_9AGAR|nr:hypothetical protein B0H16DRAFT_1739303 [Mycena metata]